MKQIKNLKPTSQTKLRNFAQSWWIQPIGAEFSEQDLNEQIGITTSSLIPGCFLHYAVEADDDDLVKDLCENGVDVNKVDESCGYIVPLQLASDLGRSTIVKILIDHGAITEGIKVNYEMNPFTQPLTFMWGIKEQVLGRTVDYEDVAHLFNKNESRKPTM